MIQAQSLPTTYRSTGVHGLGLDASLIFSAFAFFILLKTKLFAPLKMACQDKNLCS